MTRVRHRPSRERGFTVIELLLTITITAFMMFMAWSTTAGTARIKKGVEALQERNHEIRIAMNRMVKDFSSAYLSANEDQTLLERRTLFVSKPSSTVPDIRFSSLGHTPLWANANESSQTLISYSAESDPNKRSQTNLVRRESRRLSNEQWENEPAEIDVLLSDIESVTFEFWDWKTKDWLERWNTTAPDGQKDRLPTRVRITVEIKNSADNTIKRVTQARLMMQEQLLFIN